MNNHTDAREALREHVRSQLVGIGNGGGTGSELYAVYLKPSEARAILAALAPAPQKGGEG